MFKIEKGIPVDKHTRNVRYPFSEMMVGDSFFVPVKRKTDKSRVRSAAWQFKKVNPGVQFCTRTVEGGVRIWRIA